ncbi:hypothetical protein DVR12_22675 [Chitinophaga silvatica]|uniref:Uncharacterized protein n=2 Tax=Chitinophaga silvatica TaxID=2282649 RepID=A0A3E1Y464_9BACT|nr:hypothetical protein DVR12_22675 [Chitinophaga silvatica]
MSSGVVAAPGPSTPNNISIKTVMEESDKLFQTSSRFEADYNFSVKPVLKLGNGNRKGRFYYKINTSLYAC